MHKTCLVCLAVLLILAACIFEPAAAQKAVTVTVSAGALIRRQTVVSFTLPRTIRAGSYKLLDKSGRAVPLQVDAAGQAVFVLPELAAGTTVSYRLEPGSQSTGSGVQVGKEKDQLRFTAGGRRLFSYQARPNPPAGVDIKPIFERGGYIHPVYTPSGRVVSDDYPADHFHHHGIWFAWTKTEFQGRHPDFWNVGDGTGKIEFVAVDESWSGPVHGGLKARNRYVDVSAPKPVTVLNEEWLVTAYSAGEGPQPCTMFDLVSTQNCATSDPLVLPEYRYGGIGFRGHRDWLDKDVCVFLTSEGKDRSNGHGTRARWCHIGGKIDGQLAGIAIPDHPGNFRAPQAMRINPDQPFFCYSPSLLGQWEIVPGKPYISRYRFVVYDGPPNVRELDRLWSDYADPPRVTVTGVR